jgi:BirA family transcriptional regulator, biotin operon repressor / biotin---[acetyl-CoA-carboxylase] ligase
VDVDPLPRNSPGGDDPGTEATRPDDPAPKGPAPADPGPGDPGPGDPSPGSREPGHPSPGGRILDSRQLARLQPTRFARVVQLPQTTSTNSLLLDEAQKGAADGLVAVADYQSAGRGRFDRRWEAPPGTSLLFSVLLRPGATELPLSRRHLALAAVSLALVEGAKVVAAVDVQLKWPNDLVVGDRKLAGVLAESAADGALVVGAGVNVDWAPEGEAATALSTVAARPVDRGELLVESLLALDHLNGRWDLVNRRYRASCATVGREVIVQMAAGVPVVRGQAVAIDEQGRLVVQEGSGALVTVAAGDVTHVRPAGAPSLFAQ